MSYEERIWASVESHAPGAEGILAAVFTDNAVVRCGSYCYGGRPAFDVHEALFDLVEQGWYLSRVKPT